MSTLTLPAQGDYILGPEDVLDVTIHGLYPGAEVKPVRVRVMANGDIYLPMVGAIRVGGMNLVDANKRITEAYADGLIRDPRTNVSLAEKATTSVVVLGEVREPGVHLLPKYQNDIAHAIAAAGGFAEDAADEIEVHRRIPTPPRVSLVGVRAASHVQEPLNAPDGEIKTADRVTIERAGEDDEIVLVDYPDAQDGAAAEKDLVAVEATASETTTTEGPRPAAAPVVAHRELRRVASSQDPNMQILSIPLRGFPDRPLAAEDVRLLDGDVVVVPSRKSEVFYVVGKLSPTNFVRFNIGARERDLGAGFLLPRDREIDVVTAVAMAGYIDPIDSPTTVTVHRVGPDGEPMLISVDLILARYDRRETLLVEAGDIIYLNPDAPWWFRRTFDRMVTNFFSFGMSYRIDGGN